MAKAEWGSKHRCTSCGAKFYDFNKSPLICPKCGAENRPEVLLKPKRTSAESRPAKPARPPVEAAAKAKDELAVDAAEPDDDKVVADDDDDLGVVVEDDDDDLTLDDALGTEVLPETEDPGEKSA